MLAQHKHPAFRHTDVTAQRLRILGSIDQVETIAEGRGIRERLRLIKTYGYSQWRKRKGVAMIDLNGWIGRVELHWYEAHGLGRFELKIKRFLE
jgi:hypothetical protein